MESKSLEILIENLVKHSNESEWIEFKHNYHSPTEIGERISALSNGASINNQPYGFLVFGVENGTHKIIGTTFRPKKTFKGNEEIEHWIIQRLSPKIDFSIFEFEYKGNHLVIFQIPAARDQPISFTNIPYIRIGSITRSLNDFPEKERKIWEKSNQIKFENGIALSSLNASDVINLLDSGTYYELLQLPYPTTQKSVLEKFESEKFIVKSSSGYSITNLGAILLAKNLKNFPSLTRKAIRVVEYEGVNKVNTKRDLEGVKGYAVGFQGLMEYINSHLPSNEEIGKALRSTVSMYPEIAVRELIANAIIHQDFSETGTGPIVEIFDDRIEITNPGIPIITPIRFIDECQSRNEALASIMRRFRICEEKGSGIDKVIAYSEIFQLPAPDFRVKEKHTQSILFSYQKLNDMDTKDKIRACYQHCCLKYVSNQTMTNQSLRERFKIDDKNAAIASRIIKETLDASLIKPEDPDSKSRKYLKYIPFWA